MNCAWCGEGLPSGALFCAECGRPVGPGSPQPRPVVPAVGPTPASAPTRIDPPGFATASVAPSATTPGGVADGDIGESSPGDTVKLDADAWKQLREARARRDAPPPVAAPVVTEPPAPPVRPATPVVAPAATPAPVEPHSGWTLVEPSAPPSAVVQGGERRTPPPALLSPADAARPATAATSPIAAPPMAKNARSEAPAPSPLPPASTDLEGDLEETRLVNRTPKGDRFVLQFSTGEAVSVTGTGLIGRNPVPEPGENIDALVAIKDPGRSVSKTHLAFGQERGVFWITDRFSGNGTSVREPESPLRQCEAGKRYPIVRGTRVEIGEQFFVVS